MELQAIQRVNLWVTNLGVVNETYARTLSGKIMAFEGIPAVPVRGVRSPPRRKPTRFAADAIQLLPCSLVEVKDGEVECRSCVLISLLAVCWVEERVGDMKCGDLPLVWLSSLVAESRAFEVEVVEIFDDRLTEQLAFAVMSVKTPILSP